MNLKDNVTLCQLRNRVTPRTHEPNHGFVARLTLSDMFFLLSTEPYPPPQSGWLPPLHPWPYRSRPVGKVAGFIDG